MATNEEVLRAFVVSLGWKSEAAQQKEFVGAIEGATLKANLLAQGIAEMAKSIAGSIEGASQNFLQLGVMADQTRTSVRTILSLQQALTQFGGSAGEAQSILQTVSKNLRSMNDGNLSYFKQFGINQNKVTKEITWDLGQGQRALANMSDATVTQFAELAGIPQSVAELIQHHGEEMQTALNKAQKTIDAFGINQETVNTQMRYARALNDIYFDLDQAWTVFTAAVAKPLVPALEGLNERLNADAPRISSALGVVGKAFKDDVIDPLASIATGADGLTDDATKINNFKDAVVTGLGGIKEVLDTVKSAFEEVNAISEASQEWAKWAGGIVPGIQSAVDPKRGAEGPGTIDFNAPIVSTPLGRAMYRASPWSDPGTVQPTDPSLHDRPPAIFAPSPPSETTSAAPSTPPSWFKPWTWFGGSRDADKPSPNATPDALEVGNGGGFRIPGEDKSIDFADQTVSLKSGGTTVQSGNPLPVRIEKIDPAAGGIGGGVGGGGGQGGIDNAPGARGHWGGAARGRGFHNNAPELSSDTGQPLLDEISKSEGTRGYNDAFAHQHPGTDLSKMTFDQVRDLSKTQSGSSAIGRYQFMSYTLDGLKQELGLKGDEAFTPALQDRLARRLLQRRGYDDWKAGKLSDQSFMHNLSQEWAGLTDPNTGRGFYPGQTTGHSLAEQFAALKSERDRAAKIAADRTSAAKPTIPSTPSIPAPPHTPTPTASRGMSTIGLSPSGGPWIVGRDGKRYPTDGSGAIDYHVPSTSQGTDKNAAPLSWLGASENAARLMASDWGGDTIHHHYNYDSSDNSTHHNERYSVTINGSNDPQETAAAVGSTLEKSFSKSQARQVFNQGAIA
jgi:muramidase (phage lysozyme)